MKKWIVRILYIVAIVLGLGFAMQLGWDYYQYTHTLNSAPFWVWILVRGVEFLIPAAILALVGFLLHKKKEKEDS